MFAERALPIMVVMYVIASAPGAVSEQTQSSSPKGTSAVVDKKAESGSTADKTRQASVPDSQSGAANLSKEEGIKIITETDFTIVTRLEDLGSSLDEEVKKGMANPNRSWYPGCLRLPDSPEARLSFAGTSPKYVLLVFEADTCPYSRKAQLFPIGGKKPIWSITLTPLPKNLTELRTALTTAQ